MSSLSAAHMTHFPRVVELLRERGADDLLVIGGGVIPEEDVAALRAAGVQRIFTMGTGTAEIVAFIEDWFARRPEAGGS
jgi:methylmalonyl-CoA mutase C-terminal domain/subunit